jgi:hypothetical protein
LAGRTAVEFALDLVNVWADDGCPEAIAYLDGR